MSANHHQSKHLPHRSNQTLWLMCWIAAGLAACQPSLLAQTPQSVLLTDVTASSGIKFVHNAGGSGEGFIVEGMSTGVATFDYDADGLMDIYFLNGAALQGTKLETPLRNALYRNLGNMTFADVTEEAGVGDLGYALGVTVGDYDGDGDPDIYVNNFGPNVLYRNEGNKTFTNVARQAGVENGDQVGAGVGFLDIEGDGDLDLYVANYVDFTYEKHVPIIIKGRKYQAGPQYYQPLPDSLYRNEGNGTFTDVSAESGIAAAVAPGMGLVCTDLDHDGDCDVYVCNDGQPNFLFQNNGHGVFEEVASLFGAAYDFTGKANASMGVDCGDYDQDGLMDLFTTNYQAETPVMYRNLGGGLFEDASAKARIPQSLFPHVNWGTAFADIDNDGDQDLYVVCGHFDRIEDIDDRTSMKIKNFVLLNEAGRFSDITDQCGPDAQIAETSRGLATEDFDNDGDMDFLVLNSNAHPTLLRNDSQTGHHWLKIQLHQSGSNPDAIGSRVSLTLDGHLQIRHSISGRGYQSYFGSVLHFGVGEHNAEVQVQVDWPQDGSSQFVNSQQARIAIDQLTVITRDRK